MGPKLPDDAEGAVSLEYHGTYIFQAIDTVLAHGSADVGFRNALAAHRFANEFALMKQQRRLRIDDHSERAPVRHGKRKLQTDQDYKAHQ